MPFSLSALLDDMPGTTIRPRWVCKPSLAVGCRSTCCPGAEAEALLESPGWGSWEGWSQCWRRPRSRGHLGLFTAIHHIHSFLDSFPIQVITECVVEFPVVYSRFLLIICWASLCADTVLDAENVIMQRMSPLPSFALVLWGLHLRAGR